MAIAKNPSRRFSPRLVVKRRTDRLMELAECMDTHRHAQRVWSNPGRWQLAGISGLAAAAWSAFFTEKETE